MFTSTKQDTFRLINQASLNVADDNGPTDVNTLLLSYPTAILDANRPKTLISTFEVTGTNRIACRLLLGHATDASEKTAQVNIWLGCPGVGLIQLAKLSVVTGSAVLSANPGTDVVVPGIDWSGAAKWNYVDTVTELTTLSTSFTIYQDGESNGDGFLEFGFDLRGCNQIFADFDCDYGGAASADAILIGRTW